MGQGTVGVEAVLLEDGSDQTLTGLLVLEFLARFCAGYLLLLKLNFMMVLFFPENCALEYHTTITITITNLFIIIIPAASQVILFILYHFIINLIIIKVWVLVLIIIIQEIRSLVLFSQYFSEGILAVIIVTTTIIQVILSINLNLIIITIAFSTV